MGVHFKHYGNFKYAEEFLNKNKKLNITPILKKYGELGVKALQEVTPIRTGKTAASWRYEIATKNGSSEIAWINDNKSERGEVIVLLLEYGHATKNGYYIKPRHFVEEAITPVIEKLAEDVWKEVSA